jgi:16S rRNA (uracil1498-N3)-methyltransferase
VGWIQVYPPREDIALLPEEEFFHLKKVLRKKKGAKIPVLDGEGGKGEGIWEGKETVSILHYTKTPPPSVDLLFAIGSKKTTEETIRIGGQLGVRTIQPVLTGRGKSTGERRTSFLRWEKIGRSGALLSGNPWFPKIEEPKPWEEVKETLQKEGTFLLTPDGDTPLLSALKNFLSSSKEGNVRLLIGPEGGFTPEEIGDLPTYTLLPYVLPTPYATLSALTLYHSLKTVV